MPERGPRRPPAWSRALLRLALRAWPRDRRRSHGPALLDTAEALLAEAAARGAPALALASLGEAGALLRTGLRMRREDVAEGAGGMLTGWGGDVRFAVRALRGSPGFTAAAVLTLALGIGANAAVFGLVDGVLLRPPPYHEPDRLVLVWNTLPGSPERIPVAGPDVAVVRERARTLSEVAFTIRGVDGSIEAADGGVRHARLASVTSDFFQVLGAEAGLGRVFDEGDGPGGAGSGGGTGPPAALLAHGLWRSAFGGDPAVVGRTVRVNGVAATVVGVMPPDFRLELPPDAGVATDVDVWVPLQVPLTAFHRDDRLLDQDSDNSGAVVARLAPGATVAAARAELRAVAEGLQAEVPAYAAAGLGFDVRDLRTDATEHARGVLLALLAGVGTVLLVACLNLATLVLARGLERERELSVRAALGAGRLRIARQLLVESAVLVALGTGAALVLARLSSGLLSRIVPPGLTPPGGPGLEPRTLAFTLVLAAAATLLFGLVPALRAGSSGAGGALAEGLRRPSKGDARSRRIVVASEVALSVALVLAAGLLLRTVGALHDVRPGFEPEGALTFSVSLRTPDRYRSPETRARLMKEIESGLASLPGAGAVGLVGGLPLSGDRWTRPYGLPGQAEPRWESNRADFRVATSGYFRAMGTRVLEGRSFTAREDVEEDERVVVVDEKLARRIAPHGSAVGAVLGVPLDGAPVRARVVGVVEHVRHETLDADGREAIYVPYRQEASREVTFVVRTTGDPEALAPGVRRAVRSVAPDVPVHDVRSLEAYVAEAVSPRLFALRLLAGFALLALVCTAVGLYGVVAFEVGRQTRDIGVRMAVGATGRDVVRQVLAGGLGTGTAGLAAGTVLAAGAAHVLRSLVHGVSPADPATWGGALVLVAAVTLLACWVPARRAAGLDPTEALRGG